MKTVYLIYASGAIAVAFILWMAVAILHDPAPGLKVDAPANVEHAVQPDLSSSESQQVPTTESNTSVADTDIAPVEAEKQQNAVDKPDKINVSVDAEKTVTDYVSAWRNKDTKQIDKLWEVISTCDKCLELLVDMIVARNIEEGLMLELAIKMASLNTDLVLPVFDSIIDPAQNRSYAIILSEKIINNGRPEFVSKIFELIYRAKQSGYDNFARQLTWVISKLENVQGIMPILDTITGRVDTSPEYASHVAAVFSKSIDRMSNSEEVAKLVSDYYLNANDSEKQKLWEAVSHHGESLIMLAEVADTGGQYFNVEKYAKAISSLPEVEAVEGLIKLQTRIQYSSDTMLSLLQNRVKDNPTIKVLHKLEDYMRDSSVDMDSRIYAAEGLLAVRENRHARYILEKVINNAQHEDSELQAYIGGRI